MDIRIRGARENNLKGIDVDLGDGLTVVTGISGSGKTSLVFDTLYHEARRRLLDIISTSRPGGWRHQLVPAQVESITGLGPAIAVGQNVLNRNPLSTLATASGLHPFLRLLYANYSVRHCPACGAALSVFTEDETVERVVSLSAKQPVQLLAPLLRGVRGSHRTLLEFLGATLGVEALHVDGFRWQSQALDPDEAHDLDVDLGWLDARSTPAQVREIVQRAAALGSQAVVIRGNGSGTTHGLTVATAPVCLSCGAWFEDLEPKHFHTACRFCGGQGCERCHDTGLHPQAAAARWEGLRFPELLARSVAEVWPLFDRADLPSTSDRLLAEIRQRVAALSRVGLGYVTLDRSLPTLSRGESQRVRLAVALTSRLEDMLHILDEPTIGQHPADVGRLLPAFRELPGPVVYVEHDRMAAAAADHAIDLGPGAGAEGGDVVFAGSVADLWEADTPTGRHFSFREQVRGREPRPKAKRFLSVLGAGQHNLRDIDVEFPLGRLTVITGVSGSGKSTLVEHVLVPSLAQNAGVGCNAIKGIHLRPVLVDQSPIGRNPRSNPATYTKLSDIVRELFAQVTGLSRSHFSFNRPEGACPTCKGMGAVEVKMQYLASVWIRCSDCDGQRFNEDVLAAAIQFGKHRVSIADLYRLSVQEVRALFRREDRLPPGRVRAARRILRALCDVGLGYLPLGQPSPTLSGGEAQRVRLTKYLGKSKLADRLLILDEPSTGLHPQDLDGLLIVLDRLVEAGATVIVVEHNTDLIRSADWIVDLGPGAGPAGGRVIYAGPPDGLLDVRDSGTAGALREEHLAHPQRRRSLPGHAPFRTIEIRNARANNLKGVSVEIPKGKLTVVTGVSGSGKSSLVGDILEAEARRRYLESLSMYERQGTREGPEAPVDSVTGLGVTLTAGGLQAHTWSTLSHFTRRASVGRASELSFQMAILMARLGERLCGDGQDGCGIPMTRTGVPPREEWLCPACGATAPVPQARHFSTTNYASACGRCTGTGELFEPQPDKLIIHPEKPLCAGAMYSPGYWPQTYLCRDTGFAQALGERYGFDPANTPWKEMSNRARQVFLFGDEEPLEHTYRSKSAGRLVTSTSRWAGFYGGWVRDWDVHGTYTRSIPCPECGGAGLQRELLAITLVGHNLHELSEMPLSRLSTLLDSVQPPPSGEAAVRTSLRVAHRRLGFLQRVGLGYLHLNRPTGTLSAGEAQRIQLAGLLGSGLTSLTVLLDEPSRGMHPCELEALTEALHDLRDDGSTVIVVEHDLQLIRAADHVIDMGPGAGVAGGQILACGTPEQVAKADTATARWLRSSLPMEIGSRDDSQSEALPRTIARRQTRDWLLIKGACANNLRGETVGIPLGSLTGVCGVSGSGKSTLLIDTLGRALVRKAHTSSFAQEPQEPGEHEAIENAPGRTVLVDQARRGILTPAAFLGLKKPLMRLYAASPDAQALGLDAKSLGRSCSACKGRGALRIEMGFLPDLSTICETCQGTGYVPEAWEVRLHELSLPEINALTLEEVYALFADEETLARPLSLACEVGLGYLVWHQPAYALSGGEVQRLKIVKELARRNRRRRSREKTLYILDEPTVGQHMEDVVRLVEVLHRLVDGGNTVVLVEHHPYVLAACDWLIELGPGGGPEGGRVVASGTPDSLSGASTPTAPYLRALAGKHLEAG